MASEVDICNAALSLLGDDANISAISPPDGSSQAGHCARFYPMARDELLEMHPWRFNTLRANLAVSPIAPPVGWTFAYACPSTMVKPIAVLMPNTLPDLFLPQPALIAPNSTDVLNAQPFVVEANPDDGTPILYTNVEDACLLYSISVTDTTKFTALFRRALARLLASYLAGPIIKGSTGADVGQKQLGIFEKMDFPAAAASDANSWQANPYTNSTPAPIAARL